MERNSWRMAMFMLNLHDDPRQFRKLSPEEMQRIIEEYGRWAGGIAARGKLHGGHKLRDEPGKLLRRQQGTLAVKDGPFSETKEILGGFFLIEAESMDEVVALCGDCPHLKYGTIEIRLIEPT